MRAVILGGGRLVEGPGLRSDSEKGRERLCGTAVGDRVASALVSSGHFDEVVYCGSSEFRLQGVRYVSSSPAKHFFKTLDFGIAGASDDETVAVFASDLPLISNDALDAFAKGRNDEAGLGLFYTTNREIQERYPDYNPNKRYASFEEGDIVFSNAFTVKKATWDRISNIMDRVAPGGKLSPFGLAPLFLKTSPALFVRAFVHSNSKLSDSSTFVGKLKKSVSKPSLTRDIVPALSNVLGDGISVSQSAVELSIDFDRRAHQAFFETVLSSRSR